MKRKTEQLNNSSGKIGLKISTKKTKQMGINPTSQMTRVFVHKCLRIILRIRWPMKISNKSVREKRNQEDIMVELANRRWSWIGHVLRKPQNDITREALFWTPEGRRRRGRPRLTCRRSVEAELKGRLGLTWGEASRIAQDRKRWGDLVGALCGTWRKEA